MGDPEVVRFSRKAGVVLAALVALIAVMSFAWPWMPWTLRDQVLALDARQTRNEQVIREIRDIMTIQAVLMSQSPESPVYQRAKARLELMTEITFNPEKAR